MALKVDIMKAIDSMSRQFLSKLLCKFGLSDWFTSLVMNNLHGAWFSVLVNGKPFGFFQGERGIKNEDFSPFLFLLVAKALSCGVNGLLSSDKLSPFSLPRGCIPITHLSFANDVLIFLKGQRADIKSLLQFLELYQAGSE